MTLSPVETGAMLTAACTLPKRPRPGAAGLRRSAGGAAIAAGDPVRRQHDLPQLQAAGAEDPGEAEQVVGVMLRDCLGGLRGYHCLAFITALPYSLHLIEKAFVFVYHPLRTDIFSRMISTHWGVWISFRGKTPNLHISPTAPTPTASSTLRSFGS